jgi:flagellar hook-associated protein 2
LTSYDATSNQGGPLLGDSLVLSAQSQVKSLLNATVPGGTFTSLAQVGVTFQTDGTLALDSSKLSAAMSSNPQDIAALFSQLGRPSDARVNYVSATSATQPGTYALQISQPATQAALAGSAPAGLTITAGVNDTPSFTVDGHTVSVKLAAGVYASASDLTAQLQSQLNGALQSTGSSVQVGATGGKLTVTSSKFGSTSGVSVASDASSSNLFGATQTNTAGVDVAGTLGGIAMIGSGQTLLGPAGTPVEGMQLTVQATAPGSYGTVSYSTGVISQISSALDTFLSDNGGVASRIDGLNASLKSNNDDQTQEQARLNAEQAQLTTQYTALNTLLASMNSTMTYLTQQIAALPKLGGSN